MSKKREKFSEQIRRAIEASGRTRYWLSQQTGIDQATLSRFMLGKAGLSMEALDSIAGIFGWTLQYESKPTSKRSK